LSREKYPSDSLKDIRCLSTYVEEKSQLSLKDYKIDYSRCLGKGIYGSVYKVTLRPENEKGFWSYWFPYLYDYIYRVNGKSNNDESKKYCIKIFKPAIQVLCENLDHPLALQRPIQSFSEPSEEFKTNQILRKHEISGITFFNSDRYSQLKTRVRGKTLRFYLDRGDFIDPEQFEFRKSFVNFLQLLYKSNLAICDIHTKNLMYDKHRDCWEIIDGSVIEMDSDGLPSWDYNDISSLVYILIRSENHNIREMFETLNETAKANLEYTLDQDKELLDHLKPLSRSL
jgi:hypothetical protein